MILRRITEHVKAQNWTAVGLDFFIVVVGVFVGIQMANWNEARKEEARARDTLEYLQADFVAISDTADALVSFYEDVIGDMEILSDSLKAGEIRPEDEAAVKNAISLGESFGDPPPPSGAYRDLLSSGNLALIRDKELRFRLIEYDQSLQNIVESDANIHNMLVPFVYALRRYTTLESGYSLPNANDVTAYTDVRLPAISSVDFGAILSDPDFSIASDRHRLALINRHMNITVTQNKINEIRKLIDKNLKAPN